jgi:glycosyltransferase involved in cell wall biosynthesis
MATKLYSLQEIRTIPAPDVIHVHRSADLWRSVVIKELTRAHLLFTNHMGSTVSKKDPFHRLLYSRVNHILAISDAVRLELLKCLPIESRRLDVLHLGVDLKAFRREERRESASIAIGCTSRIEPEKGQRELIMAFNRIADEYPNARLRFAGGVTDQRYFEELQKVKTDRVDFIGVLEDVKQFLEKLDIYVFPSHGEAFGLALCEAMALELPCIACRERGTKEIVEDGTSGILVRKGSIEELENALRMLMSSRQLRRKLGRAARKRVESNFCWEMHLRKLTDYYRDLSNSDERSGSW